MTRTGLHNPCRDRPRYEEALFQQSWNVLIWFWRSDYEIAAKSQKQRFKMFQFWLIPHCIAKSAIQKGLLFGVHSCTKLSTAGPETLARRAS